MKQITGTNDKFVSKLFIISLAFFILRVEISYQIFLVVSQIYPVEEDPRPWSVLSSVSLSARFTHYNYSRILSLKKTVQAFLSMQKVDPAFKLIKYSLLVVIVMKLIITCFHCAMSRILL